MIDYNFDLFITGKYKNRKVSDIFNDDEQYIWWIIEQNEHKKNEFSIKLVSYLTKFFSNNNEACK